MLARPVNRPADDERKKHLSVAFNKPDSLTLSANNIQVPVSGFVGVACDLRRTTAVFISV